MFSNRFYSLRKKVGLTQEQMAEKLSVTRQAIQKWEDGSSVPEAPRLISIAQFFNVSLDYLLTGVDTRSTEELRTSDRPVPSFENLHTWEAYSAQLNVEYQQCLDEGKEITPLENLMQDIGSLPCSAFREQLADVLYDYVRALPIKKDYPYQEPDEYEEIAALSIPEALPDSHLDAKSYHTKLKGAWLGRICGCLLGKTVEGIRLDEFIPLLKETGNYPIHRYILRSEMSEEIYQKYTYNLRQRVFADDLDGSAPVDDDTNYVVLALMLLEKYGRDFTSNDVMDIWLALQPKNAYCTAERVAFRNFVMGYYPHDSAVYKNPYREWIGAQIRGDFFGYINPGHPAKAAEMAWRDARISHIKNGIYGEMFAAAMIAAAAVTTDIPQIVRAGLGTIPATSRLYKAIHHILDDFEKGVPCEEAFEKFHKTYDDKNGHHWCHTISNACIVALALLYSGGSFDTSICLAVEAGFDTDCNGATVGSIMGMRGGETVISSKWTAPVNGKLKTSIFGCEFIEIDDAANRTLAFVEF